MNQQTKNLSVIALAFGALVQGGVYAADSLTLERSASTDLAASSVHKAAAMPLANTSKEAVTFSQALAGNEALESTAQFIATSVEYRQRISAAQLNRGITLRTQGAGAVVSLSPVGLARGAALQPQQFNLTTADGRVLRGAEGMDQLVDQRAIDATGVPFSNGMIGFRINQALGGGDFVLSTQQRSSTKEYVLNVLDRNSETSLALQTAPQFFSGTQLNAHADWQGQTALAKASAWLMSPEGRRISLGVERNANVLTVQSALPLARKSSNANGLWELHVSAEDTNGLQRDVKTAFAMTTSTARFDGGVNHQKLRFDLGVEVASAGRYSASAVLYATGANGLEPVELSASAAWLEAGSRQLTLGFDAESIKARGLKAPFEVRHLTLQDQSRLALLHRQERALRLAR